MNLRWLSIHHLNSGSVTSASVVICSAWSTYIWLCHHNLQPICLSGYIACVLCKYVVNLMKIFSQFALQATVKWRTKGGRISKTRGAVIWTVLKTLVLYVLWHAQNATVHTEKSLLPQQGNIIKGRISAKIEKREKRTMSKEPIQLLYRI